MWISYLEMEVKVGVGESSGNGQAGTQQAVLVGVLALLVNARESRIEGDADATKTEIVLARAGMSVNVIRVGHG